jgi:hypothetical protein
MREYLDRLAAEDDRGDAVAAMGGHDDEVTAFQHGGINDRLVRMPMLDMDPLACNAGCFRCVDGGAKNFLGTLLHACLVLSRRVFDHLRVGRERMKIRHDGQHGGFGADPLGQGDAVIDSLPGQFRPVGWNQDVGIHSSSLWYETCG